MRLLTVIPAVGLFFLISANPFAQSNQLPAPGSHVSDFAGVIENDRSGTCRSLIEGQHVFHNICPKSVGGWDDYADL